MIPVSEGRHYGKTVSSSAARWVRARVLGGSEKCIIVCELETREIEHPGHARCGSLLLQVEAPGS